jgi:hypothetical protein
MPPTKTTRGRTTVPEKAVSKKSAAAKRRAPLREAIGPKAMAMTIVALLVIAGGILVGARQQSSPRLVTTPHQDIVAMPEARVMRAAALTPTDAASEAAAPRGPAPVTLTGCLERDGDGFRLKDTAGASAPRSRNWKSGFLKKGSTTVDLVDAGHALRLPDQVGHRVSVTGALVDRSMSARSLRRVASSCEK